MNVNRAALFCIISLLIVAVEQQDCANEATKEDQKESAKARQLTTVTSYFGRTNKSSSSPLASPSSTNDIKTNSDEPDESNDSRARGLYGAQVQVQAPARVLYGQPLYNRPVTSGTNYRVGYSPRPSPVSQSASYGPTRNYAPAGVKYSASNSYISKGGAPNYKSNQLKYKAPYSYAPPPTYHVLRLHGAKHKIEYGPQTNHHDQLEELSHHHKHDHHHSLLADKKQRGKKPITKKHKRPLVEVIEFSKGTHEHTNYLPHDVIDYSPSHKTKNAHDYVYDYETTIAEYEVPDEKTTTSTTTTPKPSKKPTTVAPLILQKEEKLDLIHDKLNHLGVDLASKHEEKKKIKGEKLEHLVEDIAEKHDEKKKFDQDLIDHIEHKHDDHKHDDKDKKVLVKIVTSTTPEPKGNIINDVKAHLPEKLSSDPEDFTVSTEADVEHDTDTEVEFEADPEAESDVEGESDTIEVDGGVDVTTDNGIATAATMAHALNISSSDGATEASVSASPDASIKLEGVDKPNVASGSGSLKSVFDSMSGSSKLEPLALTVKPVTEGPDSLVKLVTETVMDPAITLSGIDAERSALPFKIGREVQSVEPIVKSKSIGEVQSVEPIVKSNSIGKVQSEPIKVPIEPKLSSKVGGQNSSSASSGAANKKTSVNLLVDPSIKSNRNNQGTIELNDNSQKFNIGLEAATQAAMIENPPEKNFSRQVMNGLKSLGHIESPIGLGR